MKPSTIALVLIGMTFGLSACNRPDNDRTTSIPRGIDPASTLQDPTAGRSAPAAPLERGPIPPNANAAAPGTDATAAFAKEPELKDPTPSKDTGASAEEQQLSSRALDAAVKEPDTASADAAKKAVTASNASGATTSARDTDANRPRSSTMTKDEEVNQLPKAGQANNHSSTALEKDSGR
jgi:hypothetical protein